MIKFKLLIVSGLVLAGVRSMSCDIPITQQCDSIAISIEDSNANYNIDQDLETLIRNNENDLKRLIHVLTFHKKELKRSDFIEGASIAAELRHVIESDIIELELQKLGAE